jgi:ParB/RepB/Spo0J family partition protein
MSELVEIKLDLVDAGDNDRKVFDQVALEELAESIRDHGLAQPITVRPKGVRFEIVAGERRTRACRLLGWTSIPAIVREMDDEQAAAIMLAENVARVDLNPMDEAKAYHKRMTAFGWSVPVCAQKANVSESKVRSRINLLKLAEDIQVLVASGQMGVGYAEAMADLDHNRQRIAMRYFGEAKRPTLSEFRELVGKLYAEQASESMFDLGAFFVERALANPETDDAPGLPTHPALPAMRGAMTVGQALERYLRTLLQSGDPAQKDAALVVSTVFDGLIRSNLAHRPKQILEGE